MSGDGVCVGCMAVHTAVGVYTVCDMDMCRRLLLHCVEHLISNRQRGTASRCGGVVGRGGG